MTASRCIAISFFILLLACSKEPGADPSRRPDHSYNPELSIEHFRIDGKWQNPYLKVEVGKIYVYEGHTEDGDEHIEVVRLSNTTSIAEIPCGTLLEKTWIDNHLTEQTNEYYAEDLEGNVWALGIDVENYNDSGTLINRHGSWIAQSEGAKPGIVMPADPQPGLNYRQEYYFNIAENQAEILEKGITVTTTMGTFHDCLVIREWTELEPDILELKIYAPGIGLIKEINLSNGEEIVLVDIR
jgi:hypothetical protein